MYVDFIRKFRAKRFYNIDSSAEKNSTIIFPFPMELLSHFVQSKNEKPETEKAGPGH
jgi:hypothetical protein